MEDISLIDLVSGISTALDYVSPTVTGHHRRVGMASVVMGNHFGIGSPSIVDLLLAGLMHDIGAFSLDTVLDGLSFDSTLTEHAAVGHRLLRDHPFLERPSRMIKYHHTNWEDLQAIRAEGDREVLFMANVLNLADRVDILRNAERKGHTREKVQTIVAGYGADLYAPEILVAFEELSQSGLFWPLMENMTTPVKNVLGQDLLDVRITPDQLVEFSHFFSHIIDFRSRHTATHSLGVAETAVQLAKLAGMDEQGQKHMRLAANLHDIGKLAVPVALLDKPAALDGQEYARMQSHALVCEQVLRALPGLGEVADWACQHHERLNGKGYPHGLNAEQLSLGSRILQVADVHTAITEDRPYRSGMNKQSAIAVLQSMAQNGFLDSDIVGLVIESHDRIDAVRHIVQARALSDFKKFTSLDQ